MLAVPRRDGRRCWSIGCPGVTPSAPISASTWCSPWRHALYRRRPAGAGAHRATLAQSARNPADLLFNVPRGYRHAAAGARGRRRLRASHLFARSRHRVLRRRGAAAQLAWERLDRGRAARQRPRIAAPVIARARPRPRPPSPRSLASSTGRADRPAAAGHRGQAGAERRQARDARPRGRGVRPAIRDPVRRAAFDAEGFFGSATRCVSSTPSGPRSA